jgi:hypothetical protein
MTLILRSLVICALALAATPFAGNANAERLLNSDLDPNDPQQQTELITEVIVKEFAVLEPLVPGVVATMIDIFDCETNSSRNGLIIHLKPDGELIRNYETKRAFGFAQLVPRPHVRMATSKGLDLQEVHDQVEYSVFLVKDRIRMGDHPLEDWRACWA